MKYYVYHLIDPRDGVTFYIGKGTGGRVYAHESEAKNGKQSPKCDRIRDIWSNGLEVDREIVKRFSDENAAYAFEAEEIERYGLGNLTNLVPGGGGSYGSQKEPKKFVWTPANIRGTVRNIAAMIRQHLSVGTVYIGTFDVRKLVHHTIRGMAKACGDDVVIAAFADYNVEIVFSESKEWQPA